MKEKYTLSADCFLIPYPEKTPDSHLAYFPIQSLVFEINEDAAKVMGYLKNNSFETEDPEIKNFLDQLVSLKVVNTQKEIQPYIPCNSSPYPTRTILLLTDKCMLGCLYCYKDARAQGSSMPSEIAEGAIEMVIKNAKERKTGEVFLGFHGGGEPTLNWKVLTGSYSYAKKRCREESLNLITSLCTNGIMSKKKALWIAENMNELVISIDGPPEIQNRQRPFQDGRGSFRKASETIDLLNKLKKRYALRVTATEFTEGNLAETVEFLIKRFNAFTICIEPLYVCGRCETSGCRPPSDKSFINDMIRVYETGKRHDVSIQYSGNRISLLMSCFCGAPGSNFFVTPRGEVTSCLEISDKTDPRSDFFMYGHYNKATKKFDFDNEKYLRLAGSQVQNLESCKECFARWHCGGDCLAKAPDLSRIGVERNAYRCNVNKTLLKDSLINIMNQQIEYSKKVLEQTENPL